MSDIQRWVVYGDTDNMYPDPEGQVVRVEDHMEAIQQAEQRGRDGVAAIATEALRQWYERGQRDALAAAIERVKGSPYLCNCSAGRVTSDKHDGWCLQNFIIAAIAGGSHE